MLLPWIQERGILSRQNVITQIGTQPGHCEENYSSLPAKCQGRANDLQSAPPLKWGTRFGQDEQAAHLSISSLQQPHLPRTNSHHKMTAPIHIPTASCPPQPESRVPWVCPAWHSLPPRLYQPPAKPEVPAQTGCSWVKILPGPDPAAGCPSTKTPEPQASLTRFSLMPRFFCR